MNPADPRRFGGIERLYGEAAFEAYRSAHVVVVGLGGVGSWCAEALARSAVGRLTLVDGDTVSETNINRQLPALSGTVGLPKARVLAERFAAINPDAVLTPVECFIEADNTEAIDGLIAGADLVVDAIDSLAAKAALSARCKALGVPIVVSGGAGGRIAPGSVTVADLSRTTGDALLSKLRTTLRKEYGFPAGSADPKRVKPFGIRAVFSTETPRPSLVADKSELYRHFGTAMPVTASVGLRLAAEALALLAQNKEKQGAE